LCERINILQVSGVSAEKKKSEIVEKIESPAKSPFGLPVRKTGNDCFLTN
jgi:hypothetical protein